MDYDDDDISRHNLQLAGDSRTRSSSVSKPYDFPKFEFDDSLQGHLRFDSLVETEVFLGIQSQEDSQWIEDYSRGSNGMEFNPNPADSCSISRRHNVWSEATSSESVEMLLKSVGQEEMMPASSVMLGKNASDDQDASGRHLEPGLSVRNLDLAISKDEDHKDYPTLIMHEEQLPQVKCPLIHPEKVESSCEKPLNLVEKSLIASGKTSDEKSVSCGVGGETSCHTSKVDSNFHVPILSNPKGSQLMEADSHVSCDEDGKEHVFFGTVQGNTITLNKIGESSFDISTMDSTPSVKESGVVNSVDAVEACLDSARDSTSASIMEEAELKVSAADEKLASLRSAVQTGDKGLSISSDVKDQFEGCQSGSPVDGRDQRSADLGSFHAGHHATPEGKADSSVQLVPREFSKIENVETSQCQIMTSPEQPSLLVKDDKVPVEKGDYSCNTGSVELSLSNAENAQSEKVEGCHNESASIQEEPSTHLPACAEGGSRQLNVGGLKADSPVSGQAIVERSKQDAELPVDSVNTGSDNLATLTTDQESKSVGEDVQARIYDSHNELESRTFGEREAEYNVVAATVSCSGFGKMGSVVTGFSNSAHICDKDAKTRLPDEHLMIDVSSVSEVEAGVAADSAQNSLSDAVVKSNELSSQRSPPTEATTALHVDNPTVKLGCDHPTLEGGDAEVVTRKLDGDQESLHVADVDKASCGSPTIISSSEPSRVEKEDQEEPRTSEVMYKAAEDSHPLSEDVKGKDSLGDDNSFTFRVNALPETSREPGNSWSPFGDAEESQSPSVESLPSSKGKMDRISSPKIPRQNAPITDSEPVHGTSKGASERKGRRSTSKAAVKDSTKKGSQAKGVNQETSAGRQDKGSNILFSAPSSSPLVQFGNMQSYGNVDTSKTKTTAAGVLPASKSSEVNASVVSKSTSHSPGFRQPFTDLQQVQLRAQIFVYGSLIQGTAPDEACMVSAFGPSDAGRSSWDSSWRTAVERLRSQKSSSSATETPLHSQSGVRGSDSAYKQSTSKVVPVSMSKVCSRDTPATIASPIIPLSSPLWSLSTPSHDNLPSSVHKTPVVDFQQKATPMQSYQTPPIRSFIGHTSWPSQTCFPNPWLATAQSPAFNSTVRFQPVTMTETVKLTPVKDTSIPPASALKHVTSTSAVRSASPSPAYGSVSSLHDSKPISSPDVHSGDSKPRKRKKGLASEVHHSGTVFVDQALQGVNQSVVPLLTSAVVAPAQEAVMEKLSTGDRVTVCSTDPSRKGDPATEKSGACSEETLKRVAVAKSEAENAAGLATTAVAHCEELWGRLTKQKESVLTTEGEAKLVSAAAAIAAAASVAKAAAAAARIACNAALQAKLMADEAIFPGKVCSGNPYTDRHNTGNSTPVSILKGDKPSNQSSSILVAAKEAAKRRVEAASAASKQAENLDAIVKAAELAAAAVSQAGKIVAMGEPLVLNDLIEAGPEGYWKLPQSPELAEKLRGLNKDQSGATGLEEAGDVAGKAAGEYSVQREGSRKTGHAKILRSERWENSVVGQSRLADNVTFKEESRTGRDGVEAARVGFESDGTLIASNVLPEHDELAGTLPDDSIKEGSFVEVFKCGDGLKSAWYSGNVLKLQEGKAYVSFCDLSSDEGSGNLFEWVSLESEGEKAPAVRVAHPTTSLQYQGTRKRRRAALGDYSWCVGDKVDVWIDDCWWEGVVTEKDEKDETTLKAHFPAQGETLTVRAWNLRTSRSWINGKWVEWSSLRAHNPSDQSDTPQEKRQKLGSPALATKGKDKLSKDLDLSVKPEESKLLPLSTSERTFDIGKTVKEDKKYTGRRPLRSGQQEEGSRVVFGVPKPTGKKRKFMEVSKQFPANKGDKSNEATDTVKSAKHLVPQGAGSRGWKMPSRNDSREKRTVEARPRIPGTRKSQRTLPRRDNGGSSSGHDSDNGIDRSTDVEDPVVGDDSSEKADLGFSISDEGVEAPLSSLLPHSLSGISKRTISSNNKSEQLIRGKLAPPRAKLSKIEEDKVYTVNSSKVGHEVAEPRRSHRRFQPTHRLLEGLQSSMIIPKMASVSNDRVQKNQNRSVMTRGK